MMAKLKQPEPLWIIIPAFNEALYIKKCLYGLASQADKNFIIVLVDNVSTDDTAEIAKQTAHKLKLTINIIKEHHKGTGFACRTGFSFAISKGAQLLARTDGDCVPDKGWVKELRHQFNNGYEFVGGLLKPDPKDSISTKVRFHTLLYIIRLFIYSTRLKKGFRRRFMLSPGGNLAITAKLYKAIGGFSKTSIETGNEDIDLADRVLIYTDRVKESNKAIVYTSSRRIIALGLRGTLRWYAHKTEKADIR